MMEPGSPLTYAVFALVCLVILTLPFVPAFREWRSPTDVRALPVLADYTSDIDHFAVRLHGDVEAKLGAAFPTGYEDFDMLGSNAAQFDWSNAKRRMISPDITVDSPIRSAQQLYVRGSIRAGAKSMFPSLYATGDIDLGTESEVRDWAHADGVLRIRANGIALRRISAGTAIELGNDTWFERMHAPSMYFGSRRRPAQPGSVVAAQAEGAYADLPDAVQQTPLLYLVRGNCALPPHTIFRGSLVVTGFLIVGAGTTVVGDVKAREGISIDHQAAVEGAVTCEKRVYVFKEARVYGPVTSESDILIGSGAVVGLPDVPTTVSAGNIIVEDGVVVHGTIWAHEIGMVKTA